MQTLDDIRAEIVKRCDRWATESRVADHNHALAIIELEAHDRAVAAMPNGAAHPAPARKERRAIAALVLAALTHEPQTTVQIAHAIGVQPSRVETALAKLGPKAKADEFASGWVRSDV